MSHVHKFEISGHTYTCTLHDAIEGMGLSLQLSGIAVGALSQALDAGADPAGLEGKITDMLGDIGAVLRDPAAAGLIREMMRHTTRDGKRLGDNAEFGVAYAGNYNELWIAVARVAKVNGFFPELATFGALMGEFGINAKLTG